MRSRLLGVIALALLVAGQGAQASTSKTIHYHYWAGAVHYTVTASGKGTSAGVTWTGSGSGSASLTVRFPASDCKPCIRDNVTVKSASLSYRDVQTSDDAQSPCTVTVTGTGGAAPGTLTGLGLSDGRFHLAGVPLRVTEQTSLGGASCPAGLANGRRSFAMVIGAADVGGSHLHVTPNESASGRATTDYLARGAWRSCPVPVPGYMPGPWTTCKGTLTVDLTYHTT